MKLAELKKLAEAATPGPWEWRPYTEYGERRSAVTYKRGSKIVSDSWGYEADKNAAFIAAANPATIKALIELAEQMQEALVECQNIAIDRNFATDKADKALAAYERFNKGEE